MNYKQEQEERIRLKELQNIFVEQVQAEENELQKLELEDSFYQKLSDGFDVDILIVGDSIGAGSGTQTDGRQWFRQLKYYIEKTYHVSVGMTNVSMGGNASYAGYVRVMMLDDDVNYDLAIVCYGQNDNSNGFEINYEAMIQALQIKYPGCSIISVLESAQKDYTEKMLQIQEICAHYSIPVADTIAPFRGKHDILTADGVHPNDDGQDVYFHTVKNIIDRNVINDAGKMSRVETINDISKFKNFAWYGVSDKTDDQGFVRVDDVTYILKVEASGILGIDYSYVSGENQANIYIDGEMYRSPTVTFDYDFSQRHILIVSEDCAVHDEIKIVFSNKEQADGFRGMCFSWA